MRRCFLFVISVFLTALCFGYTNEEWNALYSEYQKMSDEDLQAINEKQEKPQSYVASHILRDRQWKHYERKLRGVDLEEIRQALRSENTIEVVVAVGELNGRYHMEPQEVYCAAVIPFLIEALSSGELQGEAAFEGRKRLEKKEILVRAIGDLVDADFKNLRADIYWSTPYESRMEKLFAQFDLWWKENRTTYIKE